MRDNLARKPHLSLVPVREPASEIDVDFIPKLIESSVEGHKRWWRLDGEYSRWVTSLGIVLLMYAVPLAWWLWPDNAPGANLPPARRHGGGTGTRASGAASTRRPASRPGAGGSHTTAARTRAHARTGTRIAATAGGART